MILAMDMGSYNFKTSEGIIFPSFFVIGPNDNPMGEDVLVYLKDICTMQKGNFDNTYNKAEKNFMPNLLYALDKSSRKATEYDLFLGVPVDNVDVAKQYKEMLSNKSFEFTINGKVRNVKINRVEVVGEGISSFYALPAKVRPLPTVIIDIGGRTINVAVFRNGRLINKFTVPMGTINLATTIAKRYNKTGNRVVAEEVYDLIKEGHIEGVEVEYQQFLNDMFNAIEREVDLQFFNVYYTGGGALVLENELKEFDGTIMENPLFTNVIGNRNIAKAKWGE